MTDNLQEAVADTVISELETPAVEETVETPTGDRPDWVSPLSGIPAEGLRFTEFNRHEYLFKQVQDPDECVTGKYTVFYRDLGLPSDNRRWYTMSGLLSKLYTVARAQSFFNNLASQIEFVDDPVVHGMPFALTCNSKTRQPIQMFEDDSMKAAFEIVTGIDSASLANVQSSIDICISNSYDGTKSIHMDYVVRTITTSNGLEQTYHDYFILANHSHSFEHITHSLGSVTADITNTQGYLTATVNILKNTTVGLDVITKEIGRRMRKDARGQFNTYWENLPVASQNLLFVLVFASHCLDNNYDVKQHIDLRSYVNGLMHKLFSAQV